MVLTMVTNGNKTIQASGRSAASGISTILSLLLIAVCALLTACISSAPKFVIDTAEPAEDFVVVCQKSKDYLIAHNASSYTVVVKALVVKSGEVVDCGTILGGTAVEPRVMHPVFIRDASKDYIKDGLRHMVFNKTRLDFNKQQQTRFEAGYWNKSKWPGSEFANSLAGCGFDHQYLKYYREVRRVEPEYFRSRYNDAMLACMKHFLAIKKKYTRSNLNIYSAEELMRRYWTSDQWRE